MLFPTETAANNDVIDINESNAQSILIEGSQEQLVLCHFWSPRSEPSLQQQVTLEKLHQEYLGQFILAKTNTDEQAMIAQQLNIQSLPTVLMFQAGQPIDGFAGPQDEAAIREFLEKYLPKPWDLQFQQAQQLMAEQDFLSALELLEAASKASNNRPDINKALAHCYVERNRLDEAEQLLEQIMLAEQDQLFKQLVSQIELKRNAAESPEIIALQKQVTADPEDLDVKMQLALQYYQVQQHRKACELILSVLHRDKNYDNARKTLLDIFKSLGNKDPIVIEFQRQLFSLLY